MVYSGAPQWSANAMSFGKDQQADKQQTGGRANGQWSQRVRTHPSWGLEVVSSLGGILQDGPSRVQRKGPALWAPDHCNRLGPNPVQPPFPHRPELISISKAGHTKDMTLDTGCTNSPPPLLGANPCPPLQATCKS